ncbi:MULTISPECIES: amino acid ABC transporter ATP-binding protein [Treponema]|uniref:Amino acid ABC transporter ATP-binding protein n=1 Tax=Treponema putidum TaxID=221027 RepID=A0AAE9SLN4_9SPIR|nr:MULTISPECIES: amino acid ABC transporter ATP-binding protein [Treponema]UTD06691.1 amino acid ABC transporter ATP-binding protein [Treponema denticola]UTY28993.1 amino acid ABC transporter ATP-binding protein [Treponema putidum]UTY31405.1 amino acid ABC transporter ATP-binding protein [Treponema putidum]UTY33844.1 amino acid ABC transporter ATP-binding protein [Treponema putidum]UYT08301.1 amino acid ABC transporter ATP-binding protein [Treponema denticola]
MLKVENIYKSFGSLKVLNGISFSADKGEVIAIIGPSGMGKSTLLRCINLLEEPDSGSIEIDGVKFTAGEKKHQTIRDLRAKTAMVFQNYNLFKNKTVIQNIMLPMISAKKNTKKEAELRALDLLNQIGLSDKKNVYPSKLSGGQQQRVGIARALAVNPSVLLFDEPTSSLDPELVNEVLEIILALAKNHQSTMLIVTHEMQFAKEVADRIIFIDDGTIIKDSSPQSMFSLGENSRISSFIKKLGS